jgi:Lipocalin-like domain
MRKFIGLSFNALGRLGASQQSIQEQNMNRRNIAQLCIVTALLTLVSGSILAQQKALKDQLVGSWALVSASQMTKDGKKSDRWGPNPRGFAVFEANGRYSFMIYRSDVPKFASANPTQASADEAKAAIQGMTAHYGTWSIDEATKTLTTNIEAGSIPNLNGSNQKRIISSVTADEMRYTNPASQIGTVDEVVWKRVR